jgi:DmsE family decaheme c-type cytochrome
MKKKLSWLSFLLLLAAFTNVQCAKHALPPTAVSMPVIQGAVCVGCDRCADCHEKACNAFAKTIHGRIAAFETAGLGTGCETCHGGGSLHVESEDPADIITFGKLTSAQQSRICLECHTRFQWAGSEHYLNNVSCLQCHKIHPPTSDKLLAKSEPDGCYSCHMDIQAKVQYPSHHPIREGKMGCSDCHNPHGSMVGSLLKTDERLNDLCLNCHASKQGPFVFEHAPVLEDCTICHAPHGTIANNLLKQNEPFICLQCHEFHFHSGKVGYDKSTDDAGTAVSQDYYVAGQYPQAFSLSKRNSFKRAWTTKCTQCHSQIHGSDLPSQAVPGQGKALTR